MRIEDENVWLDVLYSATRDLLSEDISLIHDNVSERCVCAALGKHMDHYLKETRFRGYHVDTEYNRMGRNKIKSIHSGGEFIAVQCDLLVHSRGEKALDNLLCLEMKKAGSKKAAIKSDQKRLEAMTEPIEGSVYGMGCDPEFVAGYQLGIYFEYDTELEKMRIQIYRNGALASEETIPFSEFRSYVSPQKRK